MPNSECTDAPLGTRDDLPQGRRSSIAETIRRRGLCGTFLLAASFLRKSLNEYLWDWRHRVETRKRMGVDELGIEGEENALHAARYEASSPSHAFLKVLRAQRLPENEFTFIDLGAGKGKPGLLAARFPFKKVVGLELSPLLVEIAQRNLESYRPRNLRCRDIVFQYGDAATYRFPIQPLFIYCFNSFGEVVMRAVLENLLRSLREHRREVYVFYGNPVFEYLLAESGFLRKIDSGKHYALFVADWS